MAILTCHWYIIDHCPWDVKSVMSSVARIVQHPAFSEAARPEIWMPREKQNLPETLRYSLYVCQVFKFLFHVCLLPFQWPTSILFLLFCAHVFFYFINFSLFIPAFLYQCFKFSSPFLFVFVLCDKKEKRYHSDLFLSTRTFLTFNFMQTHTVC